MNTSKKFLAGVLACAMAVSLAACGKPTESTPSPAQEGGALYTAGTYTGVSENGKNGSVTVEVIVTADAIQSVTVTGHQETPGLSDAALERIPQDIVAKQSLAIDAVAGATVTSQAILEAAEDALKQAGADLDALKSAVAGGEEKETRELNTQMVVVGAGAAGMAAAVAAAQNGAADVIVLEKTSAVGGNAIVSGGFLEYISAPDELRTEMTAGYEQIIENFLASEPNSEECAQAYTQFQETLRKEYEAYKAGGSTKVFDSRTLLALDYLSLEPYSTPEDMYAFATLLDDTAQWFTEMGMEWKPLTGIVGYTWPRWTSPRNGFQGHGFFDLFDKVMKDNDYPIHIMLETAGTELMMEDGKVVGVKARGRDADYMIRADKGVVLATGGFAANLDMVREYNETWDDLDFDLKTTNTAGVTGDGIKMAEAVGAVLEGMGDIMLFPNADPISSSTENIVGSDGDALYVNKEGKRFVNETLDRYSISGALLEQTDRILYIISDESNSRISNGKTFNGFDVQTMLDNGQLFKADTLEELAGQLGMDPAVLTATVEEYNTFAANYEDPEFGRLSFSTNSSVDQGPFYACPRTVATHITGGGLLVNEFYQVLNTDYEPIEGLYSGGEINAYMSGISSFGDGMYIGQILFGEE